jgi:hypothetical protein
MGIIAGFCATHVPIIRYRSVYKFQVVFCKPEQVRINQCNCSKLNHFLTEVNTLDSYYILSLYFAERRTELFEGRPQR